MIKIRLSSFEYAASNLSKAIRSGLFLSKKTLASVSKLRFGAPAISPSATKKPKTITVILLLRTKSARAGKKFICLIKSRILH